MAFDKLVSNSVVGATKNGIKMNLTVTALKDKAIDTVASQIEKQIPIELPFSTREILNGGVLPSNFLSPDILNTAKDLAPPIPEPQRVKIIGVLDGIESTLNGVIQTVNVIKGTLNTITAPLNTLETIASTLNTLVSVLENAIIIVKAIPIPLGAPLGVGVPANVVTGFADILVKTDKQIEKIKPPLEAVPDAIATVNRILIPIVASLNLFTPIFEKIIQIITFIRLLLQPGPVSQADIDSTLSSITSNIQESLAITAGPSESSSDAESNQLANDELLALLESGNYEYKGFKFTLEFDSTNTFSFPARRIKAVRSPQTNIFGGGVTLYSSPPDLGAGVVNTDSSYSFSTSIQVLVDETKFNIDQYIIQSISNIDQYIIQSISNTKGGGEIADFEDKEDIPSSSPLTPAQIWENLVNQARQSLISRGFTEKESKWIMEKSGLLVINITQQIDSGLTPNEFFKQILINKGFSGGQVYYLLSGGGMTAFEWVEYIQGSYPTFSPSNINAILQMPVNLFGLSPYTGS
jgi:hypothetical protein